MNDTNRTTLFPLLLALALCACGGNEPAADGADAASDAPAAAGRASDLSAEQVEEAEYVLTMDAMRKWAEVLRNNPEAIAESGDLGGDGSLDDMVASVEANPRAREAIEKEGLSVREFVLIFSTMMKAGFAQYAIDQGADADSLAAAAGINPANLTFLKEHEAELKVLQETYQPSGDQ